MGTYDDANVEKHTFELVYVNVESGVRETLIYSTNDRADAIATADQQNFEDAGFVIEFEFEAEGPATTRVRVWNTETGAYEPECVVHLNDVPTFFGSRAKCDEFVSVFGGDNHWHIVEG